MTNEEMTWAKMSCRDLEGTWDAKMGVCELPPKMLKQIVVTTGMGTFPRNTKMTRMAGGMGNNPVMAYVWRDVPLNVDRGGFSNSYLYNIPIHPSQYEQWVGRLEDQHIPVKDKVLAVPDVHDGSQMKTFIQWNDQLLQHWRAHFKPGGDTIGKIRAPHN
jgi:hypothetical protein